MIFLTPLIIHKIQLEMLLANMRINHPSIILIKKHMEGANSCFVSETVTKEKIEKLVTKLNIRKAIQSNDIPTKLVKEFGYLFSKYLATSINRCIAAGTFVNAFKKAKSDQSIKMTEE